MTDKFDVQPAKAAGRNGNDSRAGDNQILTLTRRVALFLIPFLLAAWVILYLFPDRSVQLFAWPVKPAMTARLMASGYLAGAYFFSRTAALTDWRMVKNGFIPVVIFASLLALATVLHWDRFTRNHIAFLTWAALYALTPLLVLLIWIRNRSADSRDYMPVDARVPALVRWGIGLVGTVLAVIGLMIFSRPEWMISVWPWMLTPLTARACLAFIILPAVSEIFLALDARWSTWRLILQGQMLALVFILLAVILSWADFNPGNPATWVLISGMGAILLANLLLYFGMEHINP